MDKNVQLRLTFDSELRNLQTEVYISGIYCYIKVLHGDSKILARHLSLSGMHVAQTKDNEFRFHVNNLQIASDVLEETICMMDETVKKLYGLLRFREEITTVKIDEDIEQVAFIATWFFKGNDYCENFNLSNIKYFFYLGIPFTISDDLWMYLVEKKLIPTMFGKAKICEDGYIEIYANNANAIVESGYERLFRIERSTYGLPFADIETLKRDRNISYKDFDTSFKYSSLNLENLEMQGGVIYKLNKEKKDKFEILKMIVDHDLLPLTLVTPYENIPEWFVIARKLGVPITVNNEEGFGVHLVTYNDLNSGKFFPTPSSLLFDDIDNILVTDFNRKGLHIFDGANGLVRIAIVNNNLELEEKLEIATLVKPAEFSMKESLEARYPVAGVKGFYSHIGLYTLEGSMETLSDINLSTDVLVAKNNSDFKKFLFTTQNSIESKNDFYKYLEFVSSGGPNLVSPKIGVICEYIAMLSGKEKVLILTRYKKTAEILSLLLKPYNFKIQNDSQDEKRVILWSNSSMVKSNFDTIIFCDYPWDLGYNYEKVEELKPSKIIFIHLKDSVDDRLAIFSLRRSIEGGRESNEDPGFSEISYILSDISKS